MGFRLHGPTGESLKVNAWNWGALHEAVRRAQLFDPETTVALRFNSGIALSPEQVTALADFIETDLLPRLAPDARLTLDGAVTREPDDGTFHRTDLGANYSLQRDVAVAIAAFLRRVGGPVTVT